MSNARPYDVTLQNGTNRKVLRVYATSETNARYEAERKNPGWTARDVRRV